MDGGQQRAVQRPGTHVDLGQVEDRVCVPSGFPVLTEVPSLLSWFPDSPVAVLSRSPLGVASSFRRSSLFTRWDYRPRYQQMITMTRSGQEHRYATLIYPTMTRPASSP